MITYSRVADIWVSDLPFSANRGLKDAGWRYHGRPLDCRARDCRPCAAGLSKKWWTDTPGVVRSVNTALWDAAAAQAIRDHESRVEQSSAPAVDSVQIPCPQGLSYLPFQRAGIEYLRSAPAPRRVLVGDEMGLGKTIQAIGYLNLIGARSALVVCPAQLKVNWLRELERWLVEPRNIVVLDSSRPPPADAEIVVVNYDRLIRAGLHQCLMGWWWEVLIADEAHALKSAEAKRTIAVLGHPGNRRKKQRKREGLIHRSGSFLALTGTALLNRPIELWTLVRALAPDLFPAKHEFGKRYCGGQQKRIGWDREKQAPKLAWDFSGASNLPELQEKLRGRCMIRRLKRDVLTELPPKRHEIIVLDPRGAAREAVSAQRAAFERLGPVQRFADLEAARARGDREQIEAVAARLEADLDVAFGELARERRAVAVRKAPAVIDHVKDLLDAHGIPKVVVFAHHHEVIDAVRAHFGSRAVWVDGRTPETERQLAVDRFQSTGSGPEIFVGGIRAAGEGITLTAAAHVVFAEMDWTPAKNSQAEDRCHRIGQRGMVLVQYPVYDGSVDALIARALVRKSRIAREALG